MGCGCGGGAKAAAASVQKWEIEGDPQSKAYLTEREAQVAAESRGLTGKVVPVK